MKFSNPYWSDRLKIQMLQRWVLVHSIIYYELCNVMVSDSMFDGNAKQLVAMQWEYPEDAKGTNLWYIFKEFDGSTGFDLYHKLTNGDKEKFMELALQTLKIHKGRGK